MTLLETAPATRSAPEPPTLEEVRELNARFEEAAPQEIIRWAVARFSSRIVTLSSFGASSGALLHMLSEIDDTVPVAFLQTHYHFPETLKFRDEIAERYNLVIENWEARGGRPGFLEQYPDDLNKHGNLIGIKIPEEAKGQVRTGTDLCCWMNKVEPMRRALRKRYAYLTSLRRDGGTEIRARTRILEYYEPGYREDPLVKINPLANWSKKQLWKYINENDIPVNDLWLYGYKSIGCAPCTSPVHNTADERAGRWSGVIKKECGIHTQDVPINYEI